MVGLILQKRGGDVAVEFVVRISRTRLEILSIGARNDTRAPVFGETVAGADCQVVALAVCICSGVLSVDVQFLTACREDALPLADRLPVAKVAEPLG